MIDLILRSHRAGWFLSAMTAVALGAAGLRASAQQPPPGPGPEPEAQVRGPVHEAFAEMVTFDPQQGPVIPREPPAPIEEMPPAEKPEGDDVIWISGYWAWDEDRDNFLWVSGIWRVPPPGHTWVAGYWHQVPGGWNWVSGLWTPDQGAQTTQVTYLPGPPASLETGPSSPQPSPDFIWTSGSWIWIENRYVWRPGCWVPVQPEWVWVPAHFRWTPCGYVFVEGHWDYAVEQRGMVFAPVVFAGPVYAYPGWVYSPSVVIQLDFLAVHLFCRPRHHHYYFGDWYAPACWDRGIYPAFSFHMSSYGYDPIYAHRRWRHGRNDAHWEVSIQANFMHYREDEHARPPHSWSQQQAMIREGRGTDPTVFLGAQARDLPTEPAGSKLKFERLSEDRRQVVAKESKRDRTASSERLQIEKNAGERKGRDRHGDVPETVSMPRAERVMTSPTRGAPEPPPIPEPPKGARGRSVEPASGTPPASGQTEPPPAGRRLRPTTERHPDGVPPERRGAAPFSKPKTEPEPTEPPPAPAERRTQPLRGLRPDGTPPERWPEPRQHEPKTNPPNPAEPLPGQVTKPPKVAPVQGKPPEKWPKQSGREIPPGTGRSEGEQAQPKGRPGVQPEPAPPPTKVRPEPKLPAVKPVPPQNPEDDKKKEREKEKDQRSGREGR